MDGSPVEEVFLWTSLADMPETMVMEHIRSICTRLVPLLASCHAPLDRGAKC